MLRRKLYYLTEMSLSNGTIQKNEMTYVLNLTVPTANLEPVARTPVNANRTLHITMLRPLGLPPA